MSAEDTDLPDFLRPRPRKGRPSDGQTMKGMLPPSDLPEPPKIGSIPTGPSKDAEWAEFIAACKTAFAAVKVAKDKLRHEVNQETAAAFGSAVNVAWNRMKASGKEVEK